MLASRKPDGTSLYYLIYPQISFCSVLLKICLKKLYHFHIAIPNFDLHFGCQWDNGLIPCITTAAGLVSFVRNVVELQYYSS